nr:Mu transposase C-terminal domain-containing protein [Gammaproteobacteria bacterium]
MTPLEQWAHSAEGVRFPEPALDLDDLFLFQAQRKVQKDRTVSLNGVLYELDAARVGEKVTLRFDPAAAPERAVQVCHQGRFVEQAKPAQTYANCLRLAATVRPARSTSMARPPNRRLRD